MNPPTSKEIALSSLEAVQNIVTPDSIRLRADYVQHEGPPRPIPEIKYASTLSMFLGDITEDQSTIIPEILEERRRQNSKWGEDNHNTPEVWLAILMEEVGELAECILHKRFGGAEALNTRKEAIQIAAVVLAMLEDNIDD